MAFKKGQPSPNPKGRPKGSKDRRTLLFQQLVPHGGKLIAKAVKMALAGDSAMLTLCLNKLVANPKPVDRLVNLKSLKGTLTEKGDAVIKAASVAEITPTEASVLLSALTAQAKLIEVDDLTQRIEALESAAS